VTLGGKIAEGGDEWHKPFRIRNPSTAFGEALATLLSETGIEAKGKSEFVTGVCSSTEDPFFEYQSKPLPFVVGLMDKYSNNFIADSLVKMLDHEVNRRAGTATGGIAFIKNELEKIGIHPDKGGRSLVSGSGLTLDNRMSASDFITLLKRVHKEKTILPEFFASLPIAGLDGTLKRKYHSSGVQSRLRGKTGSLTGVQSLVGVYPTREGEWIAVAIITNGARGIPEAELAKFLSEYE